MLRIGLTGGIGAGKSVASSRFAELGATVIDYDTLAREVVEEGQPALARIVATFGSHVLDGSGRLDRARLGGIVFADPESRQRLNAIMHPQIGRAAAMVDLAATTADPHAVVVHDVPLLVDGDDGDLGRFEVVIVVQAPEQVRLRRLVQSRGLSVDQARLCIGAQVAESQRVAAADIVLDGSREPQHLRDQVDALWPGLAARAHAR